MRQNVAQSWILVCVVDCVIEGTAVLPPANRPIMYCYQSKIIIYFQVNSELFTSKT